MRTSFWMVIKARKKYGSWELAGAPKCFITKPDCGRDSFAVNVSLEIPNAIFDKPALTIGIKVPDPTNPFKINSTLLDGIQNAIESQIGIKAHVSCDDENQIEET